MKKIFFLLKKGLGKATTKARKMKPKSSIKKFNKKLKTRAKIAQRKFKKLRQKMFRNMKPGFIKCKILRAEPVDSVTGEVVVNNHDFSIPGRIDIEWNKYYSSHSERMGVCGRGWETPADARLEFSDDGTVIFNDGSGAPTYFDPIPDTGIVYEPVDDGILQKGDKYYTVRIKEDLIYYFPIPHEPVKEIYVESITDLCGNTIHYVRDSKGLKEINESGGRQIAVTSKNGRIEAMHLIYPYRDALLLVKYQYDESGNLITVYDALNSPHRFRYQKDLLVQHTDRCGLSFYYDYDEYSHEGRCIHAWGDGGLYDYRFVYKEHDKVTEVTDSLGNTSYIKYDDRYMIIEDTNPLGGVTCYEYDDAGRTTKVIDPDGNCTAYEYDRHGNLKKLTLPDGNSITSIFRKNKPVKTTDPNGALWQQEWDSRGLLIHTTSPKGAESTYSYDDYGQLVEFVDPLGAVTKLSFDDYSNLASFTDGIGHTTKFTYDLLGNITARVDPLGHKTSYEYDLKGRLVKILLPGSSTILCSYDAEDNLVSYIDENGNKTCIEYCGLGEIKRRIQPDGSIVEYHYDTEEQLIAVTNQRGERYELKRDALGRIISELDYWGQERRYTYSSGGHLKESIDPLGLLISYKTDPLGRILEKLLPDTIKSGEFKAETFTYDANGNLTGCENSSIHIEWDYDIDGRMTEERFGDKFKVLNTYNLNGDRLIRSSKLQCSTDTKTHTVNYSYNVLGQSTQVEVPGYAPLQFTYNALGQLTRETLSSNLSRFFDYSREGYLTAQKVLNAEGPVFEQQYTYDRAGNMLNKSDSVFGTDTFKYDPIGRITNHTNPEGRIKRYMHDPAGDLLKSNVFETETGFRREGEFENVSYSFDRAGNLNERTGPDGKTKFIWDANQRLIESITDGKKTTYCYDPLGRRISKETDGIKTYFYWDGDALLGDVKLEDSVCVRHREWVYYPYSFEPLAMIEGQDFYIYHNDPNGCPNRLMDTEGKVVWAARYDALGKVDKLAVNEVDNPIRMQGQYFDGETGLYYNRYRYYDPNICGFISQDPLGLAAGENVYAYAPNVWGWIDPLGLLKGCAGTHGNSKKSTRPNHVYVIKNKQTGEVHKWGISGGKISQSGKSYRAESQVRKLNRSAGANVYESKIIKTNVTREKALKIEQGKVNAYSISQQRSGLSNVPIEPPGNIRPTAKL